MLSEDPYDPGPLEHALEGEPDWKNLGPSYADAVSYAYATLAGYLRLRADHDFVMILLGDHQPPAVVSGEGARWDVPVHVIASRPRVIERLKAHGFRAGLTPTPPASSRMHALLPVPLDAFGSAAGPPSASRTDD